MKNKEQFNNIVASNIARYRKYNNLTQLALAEKLNYSDKAVAKWESGESLPEAFVLYQLANIFGITLNDLLSERKKLKMPANKMKAIIIPTLCDCIVWLVALASYFVLSGIASIERAWLCYIVAIPVSFILFLIFSSIYKNILVEFISITGIIWTTILTVFLFIINLTPISYYVFFLGIPIQVGFTLRYLMILIPKLKDLKLKIKK